MRHIGFLPLYALLLLALACVAQGPAATPAATPTDAPDLEATVQAAVSAALPTETPTPAPDIGATIAAGIEATRAALPSPTPTPLPTPDIEATVQARMAATIAAMPTSTAVPVAPTIPPAPPTEGAGPTVAPTPIPTPRPTTTPVPTATPRPTLTPTPTRHPTSAPAPTQRAALSLSDMVNQVRPAVVRISTTTSVGTGVIFETAGQTAYVITNEHVISGHHEVYVVVNDSDNYRGTVLGSDSVRDLAVVSVCCGSFHALPFGDVAGLRAGDEVIAVGYALGLSGQASITRGIVSAIRYDSNHLSDVIQTDAAINPGNSGGPMLSMSGEILGINTFSIDQAGSGRPAEGLGFAVSGTTVQDRISRLRSATANPTPTPYVRRSPTSTPRPNVEDESDEGYVFGPVSGDLRHEPGDRRVERFRANVSMADVAVSATFVNPYSAASGSWDYGFVIRQGGGEAQVQAVVTSSGRWEVRAGTSSSNMKSTGGTLPTFRSGAGQRNTVVLFCGGPMGYAVRQW